MFLYRLNIAVSVSIDPWQKDLSISRVLIQCCGGPYILSISMENGDHIIVDQTLFEPKNT